MSCIEWYLILPHCIITPSVVEGCQSTSCVSENIFYTIHKFLLYKYTEKINDDYYKNEKKSEKGVGDFRIFTEITGMNFNDF